MDHPERYGHWDRWQICDLPHERDALRAKLAECERRIEFQTIQIETLTRSLDGCDNVKRREAAEAKLAECERERDDLRARKDEAYTERNQCVALIARMAIALGYRAGIARTAIDGWSDDWHGCVYIDLPAGQVSWHYHDSQTHLFEWLPPYCGDWDGHDTPEKYRRVLSRM